jgi:hypothetical protein
VAKEVQHHSSGRSKAASSTPVYARDPAAEVAAALRLGHEPARAGALDNRKFRSFATDKKFRDRAAALDRSQA